MYKLLWRLENNIWSLLAQESPDLPSLSHALWAFTFAHAGSSAWTLPPLTLLSKPPTCTHALFSDLQCPRHLSETHQSCGCYHFSEVIDDHPLGQWSSSVLLRIHVALWAITRSAPIVDDRKKNHLTHSCSLLPFLTLSVCLPFKIFFRDKCQVFSLSLIHLYQAHSSLIFWFWMKSEGSYFEIRFGASSVVKIITLHPAFRAKGELP